MKLRIDGDSLRIRLSRAELTAFANDGRIADRIRFAPGTALGYCIVRDESAGSPRAELAGGVIQVRLPADACNAWCTSEEEAIHGSQPIDGAGELAIAVEKDFAWFKPKKQS